MILKPWGINPKKSLKIPVEKKSGRVVGRLTWNSTAPKHLEEFPGFLGF
jgi:hypothetical protein